MSTKQINLKTYSIGHITSVESSHALIKLTDPKIATHVAIGNLIAIQGFTENEFLIGYIEKVSRIVRESFPQPSNTPEPIISLQQNPEDLMSVLLIGTFRKVLGNKINVFKRGADQFPQIGRNCYLIEGPNLQEFMSLLASEIDEGQRLHVGAFTSDPNTKAIACGDRFFQRHASILGSTGSGKSWATALILEKASKLSNPNLIVFDMHGEYKPLTDSTNGYAESFRIAGPGDIDSPNPNTLFIPYWTLNRDEMLAMILDRSDQNAPNQASRFTSHVKNLKQKTLIQENKTDVLKTFTVDSPIPYSIKDLERLLSDDDKKMVPGAKPNTEKKGDWTGKLTRFISRLEAKVTDRRYGFMFQPPPEAIEYSWLASQITKILCSDHNNKGIKIIDFSEVPSDILPIVAGTFARLLYDIQFWLSPEKRTPFTLVCDEAHLYLPVKEDSNSIEKQALASFERIAKEGRKYGVSLLVVSQRPSDVSKTILSQCNNFLILRLTNSNDQLVVKKLMPDSMAGLTDILPLLDIGEALLLGDAILLPSKNKQDNPEIKPASSTLNFWQEWNSKIPNPTAIEEAIENLRKQTKNS